MLEQLKSLTAGMSEESKGTILLSHKIFVEMPHGKGIPKVQGEKTKAGAYLVSCAELCKLIAYLEKQAAKAETSE